MRGSGASGLWAEGCGLRIVLWVVMEPMMLWIYTLILACWRAASI